MNTLNFTTKDHLIHDLKAPLQRIQALSSQGDQKISIKIKKCTQYLEEIINSYMGVQTISSPSSIKSIISNKTELYPNIKFNIDFNSKIDQLEMLTIDAFSLNRILYNLLQNSYESLMKSNHRLAEITIETKNTNKDFFITISDNGRGFPPHILNGLKSHQSHEGRGIGLSAVKKILKDSAGEITLSNERPGAKAILRIPLIFKGASEIVLYEDDPCIYKYVESEFKKINTSININPTKAPKEGAFILMDIKLNNQCGLKLAKSLKEKVNCVIFLYTSYDSSNLKTLDFIDGLLPKEAVSL